MVMQANPALLILCLHLSYAQVTEKISLNQGGNFVNPSGHLVLFHGFNSVYKKPPFYNALDGQDHRLGYYKQWGFNVVRLGVLWHPTMPTQGTINETYLDHIEQQVDKFSEYGIYVILDMHQDSLSTMFGSYDAIPKWLLESFPQPLWFLRYPWPHSKNASGDWEGYTTYACQKAFQCIYDNEKNAWGYWGDFWETVARRFKDKVNVLGYELMNEPFAGNIFTNPLRAIPGYAGRHNILPVFDYLVKRIRAVDKEKFVFFESVTWSVLGTQSYGGIFGAGFDHVPGSVDDPTEPTRSVLSYHYYCPLTQLSNPADNFPNWKRIICDEFILPRMFNAIKMTTDKLKVGRFYTEFGICEPDGNPASINTIECNAVMNGADANLQSWTYWDSRFFDGEGNPYPNMVKPFARVYPRKTAGLPVTLTFNVNDGSAFYAFLTDETTALAFREGQNIAEIFLPLEAHYPSGYSVDLTPSAIKYRVSADDNHLLQLYVIERALKNNLLVEVNIKASGQ
uniref:Endoglycoceramidase n=2 Tax=Schistocephalus solidus TaxID=70667 RepID=A0A0X3PNF9_SCHSO